MRAMHTNESLDVRQVGWFAARQPGVIRFLEQRLLDTTGDTFALALEASWRLCREFAVRDRLPPKRVERSLLERAEAAVELEMMGTTMWGETCAHRQPELCDWIRRYCADPPSPITATERRRLATVLLAVLYALDEQTTGRPVP